MRDCIRKEKQGWFKLLPYYAIDAYAKLHKHMGRTPASNPAAEFEAGVFCWYKPEKSSVSGFKPYPNGM